MSPRLQNITVFVRSVLRTGFIWTVALAPGTALAADFDCSANARCQAIQDFFKKHRSPLAEHAEHFLLAADLHRLDWRFLPALSMVETGGGKYCRRHNVLGWASGRSGFQSVSEAVHHVASRLFSSPLYRGKETRGILQAYNPRHYRVHSPKVIAYMQLLSPEPVQ